MHTKKMKTCEVDKILVKADANFGIVTVLGICAGKVIKTVTVCLAQVQPSEQNPAAQDSDHSHAVD